MLPSPSLEIRDGKFAEYITESGEIQFDETFKIHEHPCMRGTMEVKKGTLICHGKWSFASSFADFPFEFTFDGSHNDIIPTSGKYKGFFSFPCPDEVKLRHVPDNMNITFVQNNVGGYNIEGTGLNVFGNYKLLGIGSKNADGNFEVFLRREYEKRQISRCRLSLDKNLPDTPKFYRKLIFIFGKLVVEKQIFGWFYEAVDEVIHVAPRYYEIIKNPMHLSIVNAKIKTQTYQTPKEFYDDVNLVFENAKLYNNKQEDPVRLGAIKLQDIFQAEYDKHFIPHLYTNTGLHFDDGNVAKEKTEREKTKDLTLKNDTHNTNTRAKHEIKSKTYTKKKNNKMNLKEIVRSVPSLQSRQKYMKCQKQACDCYKYKHCGCNIKRSHRNCVVHSIYCAKMDSNKITI